MNKLLSNVNHKDISKRFIISHTITNNDIAELAATFSDGNSVDDFVSTDTEISYKRQINKRKVPKCEDCNVEMYKSSTEYICEECGKVEEIVGGNIDIAERGSSEGIGDYNTSSNSAAPVRISGPGSYAYQKKLISSTSNYKKQQKKNSINQISNIMRQYDGPKLAQNIIEQSADLYYLVQQFCIKRGDVRIGTMAACVYRICKASGLTRKPKEIAEMFGIPQDELSNGEKILDDLYAKGSLGTANDSLLENIDYNPSMGIDQYYFREDSVRDAYLYRYFEALCIPDTYLDFAKNLVRFTCKFKIADSSITSSKCAGTIYILAMKLPHLEIKRDDIEKSCSISKSTFSRFSKAVIGMLHSTNPNHKKVRRRLRHLFKKNGIPIS